MNKITAISQYIVIGLLGIGATLFLVQNRFLQSGVYAGFGILFLGYHLLEKKKSKI